MKAPYCLKGTGERPYFTEDQYVKGNSPFVRSHGEAHVRARYRHYVEIGVLPAVCPKCAIPHWPDGKRPDNSRNPQGCAQGGA